MKHLHYVHIFIYTKQTTIEHKDKNFASSFMMFLSAPPIPQKLKLNSNLMNCYIQWIRFFFEHIDKQYLLICAYTFHIFPIFLNVMSLFVICITSNFEKNVTINCGKPSGVFWLHQMFEFKTENSQIAYYFVIMKTNNNIKILQMWASNWIVDENIF
jgi:hypothetical protein